jgi:hypothetical protein
MTHGVCLIAYGEKAEREAQECLASLRQYHQWPHVMVGNMNSLPNSIAIYQQTTDDNIRRSRYAKVTLDQWSPFSDTLYLDADTRVQGDLSVGFEMLEDGFEMLITYSTSQGRENMWHIAPDEREATYTEWECGDLLQLQGGVIWFRKCDNVSNFFEAWRREWLRWRQFDQAALLRALRVAPVKMHILGRPFNGGAVVQHRHGRAAR